MAKIFREIEILYEALAAPIGIEVEILGNFQTSLQALYKARQSTPDFDSLQIHKSPSDSTKLWIVKNPAKGAPQAHGRSVHSNPTPLDALFTLEDL